MLQKHLKLPWRESRDILQQELRSFSAPNLKKWNEMSYTIYTIFLPKLTRKMPSLHS